MIAALKAAAAPTLSTDATTRETKCPTCGRVVASFGPRHGWVSLCHHMIGVLTGKRP